CFIIFIEFFIYIYLISHVRKKTTTAGGAFSAFRMRKTPGVWRAAASVDSIARSAHSAQKNEVRA
ncbi:MAG: hypothetical protein ABI299_01180, partial [Rhodanobacter sp.]